ncbi:MAG: MFS transporter [Deltaproteobacteria bacterium]|jgi:MFS family permease|nr:MFS transporter [Deltaproteobacteria bacterium]
MAENLTNTSQTITQEPIPPLWTGTFASFLFTNFCIFMGFNMLLPTLSVFLDAQNCSETEIGFVIGSFTITSVAARLLANTLSRHLGTLKVARAGLLICALGTPFFFLFMNLPSYLVARLAQGAGFGVTSTLLVTLASKTIPHSRLGEGIGYLGLGATAALTFGPLAGIYIADTWGFVTMFEAMSLCYLIASLISFAIPQLELTTQPEKPGENLSNFFEKRALPAAYLMAIYGTGISGIAAFLALYCAKLNLPSAAIFFGVSTFGTVISRVTGGRILDRHGHRYVILPSVFLLSLAVLILIVLPGVFMLYFAAILYGLGSGGFFPSIQTLALSSVPPSRRTLASAYFFVALDVGMGVGAFLMGFLAGLFQTYRVVFIGVFIVFLSLPGFYLLLFPQTAKINAPKTT